MANQAVRASSSSSLSRGPRPPLVLRPAPPHPAVLVLLLSFVLLLLDLFQKAFLITVIDTPFHSEFRPLHYGLKASLTVISRQKLVLRKDLKDIYVKKQRNVISTKIYILKSSILSCLIKTMKIVQRLLLKK